MLQQIEDSTLAMDLLKLTARKHVGEKAAEKKRKVPQKVYAQMWDTSVMDEAIDDAFPCITFASHRHCQKLIDLTDCGHYTCSRCRINEPEAPLLRVVLQAPSRPFAASRPRPASSAPWDATPTLHPPPSA